MIGNVVKNPSGNINLGPITANGNYNFNVGRYKTASVAVNVGNPHIYGAVWDGSSNPAWTRTDDAANFPDPNPYYSGMSTIPTSPFDAVMPWAGICRVTDAIAGVLVKIPKFWYKWTRSGSAMQLQIADAPVAGFYTSPAHADRGDGVGERDYVYVGRYHCASDYKSKTGVLPISSIKRSVARTNIHTLGSNIWQLDYAMRWTINMLYLVEFANWNSQAMIGYGSGNNSSPENSGASDSMPYHTGTMKTSKTTYGVGCQYRYIEDWWGNVRDWCDGIYFSGSDIYCIKNPSNFSDTSDGIKVGQRATTSGFIKAWNNPTVSGFEYALYPNSVDNTLDGSTYITDYCYYDAGGTVLYVGGYFGQIKDNGALYVNGNIDGNFTGRSIGCRLMGLP